MKKGLIILGTVLIAAPLIARGRSNNSFSTPEVNSSDIQRAAERAFAPLSFQQIDSIRQIIQSFDFYGDGDLNKLAYIIATAWHESRLRPVRECFANSDIAARACIADRSYGTEDQETGQVYYGRGFVQLTWRNNYQKMSDVFGIDLVQNPDQVLETALAADILVFGMMNGSFTGQGLSRYINSSTIDFRNARRTVNGTDRAALIAGYAESILPEMQTAVIGSTYKISQRTKRIAKELGVEVRLSTRRTKKIDVFQDGKIIARIGHPDYPDYSTYLRLEREGKVKKGTAEKRRVAFWNRFQNCNTPNCYYAKMLLWT